MFCVSFDRLTWNVDGNLHFLDDFIRNLLLNFNWIRTGNFNWVWTVDWHLDFIRNLCEIEPLIERAHEEMNEKLACFTTGYGRGTSTCLITSTGTFFS